MFLHLSTNVTSSSSTSSTLTHFKVFSLRVLFMITIYKRLLLAFGVLPQPRLFKFKFVSLLQCLFKQSNIFYYNTSCPLTNAKTSLLLFALSVSSHSSAMSLSITRYYNQIPDDPLMLTPYDKAKRCDFYARGFVSLCDLSWLIACCHDFARGEMHAGSYNVIS